MTRLWHIIAFLAFLVPSLGLAAEHTKDDEATIKANLQSSAAVLVDVREVDEWKAGHLSQAVNVPMSEIKAGRGFENLPKDKIVYLHCQSGRRVLPTADLLAAAKFKDVRALAWGYPELVKRGFPNAN